jgi:Skp family chaperone for outer membrane proteins
MKKLLLILLFFSYQAHATEIAVIDIQKVVDESLAAKDAADKITSKKEKYQASINKKGKDLEAKDKNLAAQLSILSEDAIEKKKEQFALELTNFKKDIEKKRKELDDSYVKAIGQIQKQVLVIIKEVSIKKDIDVVIPKNQLLYIGHDIRDISDEVLEKLNKKISKVELKFNN